MYKKFARAAIITTLLAFISIANAAGTPIKAILNDTIAGFPTTLQTSITIPNEKITFRVKKPSGSIIEVFADTNDIGVAKTDLLGFHTKKSGIYEVTASIFGTDDYKNAVVSTFEVFPAELSDNKSSVSIDPGAITADGLEEATIKISLRDEYSNPITDRNVIIVSSRITDEIEKISEKASDKNGNIFYRVSSTEAGISYFTVIDRNSGTILNDREKLVFFEADYSSDFGGSYLKADLFGDFENNDTSLFDDNPTEDGDLFGSIESFEIDYPSKVDLGSDDGYLTITAKDHEGKTVKNYTGTIIISTPDDENAILPNDGRYTFEPKDQGKRTFDLALKFTKLGMQSIKVFDFDPETGSISKFIKGEAMVEVIDGSPPPDPHTSDDIEIKKPQNGSKFGGSTLMIFGKARPNTNLKVFLDEIKVADIEVDSDGMFTKELQNIDDGNHDLFVREAEGGQESSKTVNFSIDSLEPTLDEFSIYPSGPVYAGEPFTVTVHSDPDLQNATFRAESITETLLEDDTEKGKYEITIAAPMSPGEYPISVTLVDDLQNKGEYVNVGILKVIPKAPEKEFPVPENLTSTPLDSSVKISWDTIEEAKDATQVQISYGTSKLNLINTMNTDISKNEIIIENLENDKNYFFSAKTIDDAKNQGNSSGIISAIPKEDTIVIPHPAANELTATPGNERVFLRWTPLENVHIFEVNIGIDSKNFLETIYVSGKSSSTAISDLINEQKYYFQVTPKNIDGTDISEEFPIASATPSWNGSHPDPNPPIEIDNHSPDDNPKNGPIHEKIIFSSALFALAIFFIRRSLLIFRN